MKHLVKRNRFVNITDFLVLVVLSPWRGDQCSPFSCLGVAGRHQAPGRSQRQRRGSPQRRGRGQREGHRLRGETSGLLVCWPDLPNLSVETTLHCTHFFQVAQVDAYTNAEQLSQTGQQNGSLKPSGPAPTVNNVDVRSSILSSDSPLLEFKLLEFLHYWSL